MQPLSLSSVWKKITLPTFQLPLRHLSSGLCACDGHIRNILSVGYHTNPRIEQTGRNKAFRVIWSPKCKFWLTWTSLAHLQQKSYFIDWAFPLASYSYQLARSEVYKYTFPKFIKILCWIKLCITTKEYYVHKRQRAQMKYKDFLTELC